MLAHDGRRGGRLQGFLGDGPAGSDESGSPSGGCVKNIAVRTRCPIRRIEGESTEIRVSDTKGLEQDVQALDRPPAKKVRWNVLEDIERPSDLAASSGEGV
jgi:hypothetical protein